MFKAYTPLVLLASLFLFVGCGGNSQVQNFKNSSIKSDSGSKNMKDISRAIIAAGPQSGWQIQEVKPGLIVATKFHTGHMAKVDINYSTEKFTITYKDSSNLEYDGTNIQSTYNDWVKNLYKRITKNISKI